MKIDSILRLGLVPGFFLVSFASSLTAYAIGTASPTPGRSDRLNVLRMLLKKQYLRDATCSEFTSSVLQKAGLPKLGSADYVQGVRGNVNRQGELSEPPVIQDGLEAKSASKFTYSITSRMVNANTKPKTWALELIRSRKAAGGLPAAAAKTVFVFNVNYRNNKPSCDMSYIEFGAAEPDLRPSAIAVSPRSLEQCLDYFIHMPETSADALPSEQKPPIAWLREDCASLIRFSAAAKSELDLDSIR